FVHYGFSPHAPVKVDSPCNMSFESVPEYLAEVQRLRDEYRGKINLYASMEVDYFDDWGPSDEYFHNLNLDYIIGSVHFIPDFDDHTKSVDIDGCFEAFNRKMSAHFHNDIEAVVRSFYAQSMQMIEKGGFDVIGHFDKIGHNAGHYREGIENEPWYEKLVREEFDAIMEKGYIIEINTKALADHRRYFPNERYFSWLKKYNAPVIINSDVHFTHLINAGRFEAMQAFEKA
ncbi:MAG: histidinol-phosphatase, partial [Muribaculaceae bacterium]|nr:histidinol-phosphatase [Muribaculaceae bacterium]